MHLQLLFFLFILVPIAPQANVCYANCKRAACSLTNALACTDCDQGLFNINSRCVPSNIQPVPPSIPRTPSSTFSPIMQTTSSITQTSR